MVGIYVITNIKTSKVYVGQSIDLNRREREHFRKLKKGKHFNLPLQRAYIKYGEKMFSFNIIEQCSREHLDRRELFWINLFNSTNKNYGYNIIKIPVTVKQTKETREKISKARKGMHFSDSHRENIRQARLGKKATEETKEKLRIIHSKNPVGEKAYSAKITNSDAIDICQLLQSGKRICEVAKITGINYGIIKAIKQRRSWLSISKEYCFLVRR